jgi:hypothetical protein
MSASAIDQFSIEAAQRALCGKYGAMFVQTSPLDKVGFAETTANLIPINGLRHPVTAGTSGWYIWCGEILSQASDFFAPLHGWHLYERMPQVAGFLGLPPGYRFLLAGDHVDVWYDEKLLDL